MGFKMAMNGITKEKKFRELNLFLSDKARELGVYGYEFLEFIHRCEQVTLIVLKEIEEEAHKK
jgi:hypothetical protein